MTESPLGLHASSAAEIKERLAAERSKESFLLYRDPGGHQHIHTLESTSSRKITIGRDHITDVALVWDTQVSGVHAELEPVGNGWAIVDDGLSRNGTFVNGERLRGRHRLQDGDTIRVGETLAVFRTPVPLRGSTTVVAGSEPIAASLSPTQRKVLIALCRPYQASAPYATPTTNQQVADELYLSVDAVKTHLRTLFQKFGVQDLPQNLKRARLVECAFQSGAISERDLQD
jgi:pSer/pThr/pTyr-binding forkhead associated (FHA) protein